MKNFPSLLFCILLILSCSESNPGGETGETPGIPAPDFSYTSLEGQEFTLSAQSGKVVYLFFYGADCPHCRANGPLTESRIYQEFNDNPDFVAVGLDTWNLPATANTSFRNVTGITYPLLLDARQSLLDYYGNSGAYDRSVVISAEGLIVYKGTGFVNTDADTVVAVIEAELSN